MISKYQIFCEVIKLKSFTRAAKQLGYSQSAISQTIKGLENELGTALVYRKKDGITLTTDGSQYYPYIQKITSAEEDLFHKYQEITGLENSLIRLGTFTSVSRTILPGLMKAFKAQYPQVNFVLTQGEYTGIENWIKEGMVDFGFVNTDAVSGIEMRNLYQDKMVAVLPKNHRLANQKSISVTQLAKEPFILLDEGIYSLPLKAFKLRKLVPDIEYKVYDDYSILSMVREGLGVSMMYSKVLEGFEHGLEIKEIEEDITRTVALGWKNWETMPFAARKFIEFIFMENGRNKS